jgi:hypothetical protein
MGNRICQGCECNEHPKGLSLIDLVSHAISDPDGEGKKAPGNVTTVKSSFVQDKLSMQIINPPHGFSITDFAQVPLG